MPVNNQELQGFCDAVQAKREAYFDREYQTLKPGFMSYTVGKKYAKIITNEEGQGKSVFCFVDLANGNILKSASWNVPAKHPRGNIANGAAQVSQYGAAYLR